MSTNEHTESNYEVFSVYKNRAGGPTHFSESVAMAQVRRTHEDYHVTRVSPAAFDLLGFAAAGNATAKLEVDGEYFDAVRSYKSANKSSLRKSPPATLTDVVKFGRYSYSWNNFDFIVYQIECNEGGMRSACPFFFVLAQRSAAPIENGHSLLTDSLLLEVGNWSTQLHEEVYVFDNGRWMKNHELWQSVEGSSWDEVILDNAMKAKLIEDVHGFFDSKELYKQFSVPWKRGIIMHGVPGNGKTVSIKALMSSLQSRPTPIPSLYVKSLDNSNGPQYAIRAIFNLARSVSPCLLIFEDLDSLVTDKSRSYFLNEVDGLESNDGILMIGSTNHLDKLDASITKRPSRFDRKYHYRLPGDAERKAYAEFWHRKILDNPMVDFPEDMCAVIAQFTAGFSFAYLKELFMMSLLIIARGGGDLLNDEFQIGESKATSEKGTERVIKSVEEGIDKLVHNKSSLPDVDVPDHLRDNILLNVLMVQAKALLAEMDNTKVDEWPSGKPPANSGMTLAQLRRPMRMVRAENVQAINVP
ncbi:proteasome-activating nucleotidase [Patellaria atrata CBS 101060]|uniref:Proteasome-activating nucleotidase n=1 Tax=Patellaria atrata CBS 101060 TaxID=1346257 RepID=A0A9P4S914_9PEZI|nr:proteasome-activating nucleotidase [Patellaria atrata CBS 101060]